MQHVHAPAPAGKRPSAPSRWPSPARHAVDLALRLSRAAFEARAGRLPELRPGVPCSVLCGCDRTPSEEVIL